MAHCAPYQCTRVLERRVVPHVINVTNCLGAVACTVNASRHVLQEVVFVDEELQGTRLVGSGTPGSYGLLDDLFDGKVRCALVARLRRWLRKSWF